MKYLKNFWQHRNLLWELILKGIKLKYRRSYLGILWSLIEPIFTTIVLTLVFGTLFGSTRTYPMFILCGRLLYSFFAAGTNGASRSIRGASGMIKKVYVPKYLYPLSNVLYNFIIFLISLLVLIPLAIYCKISPAWSWLLIVVPLVLLIILTYGIGLILSTVNVFFRDIEYLWNVALMLIMYMSAIFYDPDKILKSKNFWLLKYNPLYGIIYTFRCCIMNDPINWKYPLYALGFGLVSLLIGTIMFYRKQDQFILHI